MCCSLFWERPNFLRNRWSFTARIDVDHAENAFCHKNCSTKMRIPMKLIQAWHFEHKKFNCWLNAILQSLTAFQHLLTSCYLISDFDTFQSPVVPFLNWLIKVRIKWFSLFQILSLEYICGFFENHQIIGKAGSFTLLWRPEFF